MHTSPMIPKAQICTRLCSLTPLDVARSKFRFSFGSPWLSRVAIFSNFRSVLPDLCCWSSPAATLLAVVVAILSR